MTSASGPAPGTEPTPVAIEEEMKRSYLDYAMSVIVARALPDARDGLKPVQRRIIYAMYENGYTHDKPFRKAARIVGDVMGKYHPHGDTAIYDALVRMAQDFAMRLPLIQGQGNFGSMDGDRAAAMRYTEARLARSAHQLIEDIDEETVDFIPNYDESDTEPTVLPARFPNLLVNGAGGIAVGMATNIPPHNLGEVIDAACALIEDPDISISELIEKHLPGPDFPTGALVLGRQGIVSAYHTGRGSVVMRAKTRIEDIRKDRPAIIVDEVPYQVNKSRMIEVIVEAVRDRKIEGIADLRDESDRDGVRVVIELKRDAEPDVVLNQLYRHSPLQTSFGITLLALDGRRPRTMSVKEMLQAFLAFREDVIRRRTVFKLKKARERAHVLVGLVVAVANIDEIIKVIRESPDPATAREALTGRALAGRRRSSADPPGRRGGGRRHRRALPAVRRAGPRHPRAAPAAPHRSRAREDRRRAEGSRRPHRRDTSASSAHGRPCCWFSATSCWRSRRSSRRRGAPGWRRRARMPATRILIQREDMVVTVTSTGYIKRVPLSTYRAQRRGGKGRSGMSIRDEDFVSQVFVASTHTPVLFFSSAGMVYRLKVYKLPLGTPQARGKAMINLLPLQAGQTITTLMPLPEDESRWSELYVAFATASGSVRRNALSDFSNVPSSGKIAMKLDAGDRLVRVRTFTDDDDILLFTRGGQCIRFAVDQVRVFSGRTSTGVRGLKLAADDQVISMSGLRHVDIDAGRREEYLRAVNARRRMASADYSGKDEDAARDQALAAKLELPDFADMAEREEFLLTVTEDGFGKRTSSYEYRIAGRDGSGVGAIDLARPQGTSTVIGAFPVRDTDHIVMVTESGQLIRCPVAGISVMGRTTRGVKLFAMAEGGDRVVSVTRIREVEGANGGNGDGEDDDTASDDGQPNLFGAGGKAEANGGNGGGNGRGSTIDIAAGA